ncbi:MAG: hypothetical protein ACI9VS_001245 [Candidatus Binatia bacterium]|jgi:hypothetical protein
MHKHAIAAGSQERAAVLKIRSKEKAERLDFIGWVYAMRLNTRRRVGSKPALESEGLAILAFGHFSCLRRGAFVDRRGLVADGRTGLRGS